MVYSQLGYPGLYSNLENSNLITKCLFQVILILRLLLVRQNNASKWKAISKLMDHREDRLNEVCFLNDLFYDFLSCYSYPYHFLFLRQAMSI